MARQGNYVQVSNTGSWAAPLTSVLAGLSKKYTDKDIRLEEQKEKNLILEQEQNRFNTTRQDSLNERKLSRNATAAQYKVTNDLATKNYKINKSREARVIRDEGIAAKDKTYLSELSSDPSFMDLGVNVQGAVGKANDFLNAGQAKFAKQKNILNYNMALADDNSVLSAEGNKLVEKRLLDYTEYPPEEAKAQSIKDVLDIDKRATLYNKDVTDFLASIPGAVDYGKKSALNSITAEEVLAGQLKELKAKGHSNTTDSKLSENLYRLAIDKGFLPEKELIAARQAVHKSKRDSQAAYVSTLKELRKNASSKGNNGTDAKTFNNLLSTMGNDDKRVGVDLLTSLLSLEALEGVNPDLIRSAILMRSDMDEGTFKDKKTLENTQSGVATIQKLVMALTKNDYDYDKKINEASAKLKDIPSMLTRGEILGDRFRPSEGNKAALDIKLPYLGFSAVAPRLPEVDPNVPKAGSTEATRSVSVEALTAYDKLNKRQQARAQNPRQEEVNRLKDLRKEEETTSEELDRVERAINTARQVAVSPRALKWVKDKYAYNLKGYEKELVIANKRLAAIREQLNPQ